MLTAFLKQPLFHFLILGALVFGYYAWITPESVQPASLDERQILVDQPTLLDFMQYRAKAFEPELFAARLAALSPEELDALIADYVREEALYREALAMGMDTGDYIIRQRLVQKVEFLLENLVTQAPDPDAETLAAYYEQNMAHYHVDAVYTFTHVFLDAQQSSPEQARARAQRLLVELEKVPFEEAAGFGDRYPFLQNYVERTRDFVANNFSNGFVDALDQLEPAEGRWYGPIESRYGYHLVMLRARKAPFTPPLDAIGDRVLSDYRYEAMVRRRLEAEDEVVAEYEIIKAVDQGVSKQ